MLRSFDVMSSTSSSSSNASEPPKVEVFDEHYASLHPVSASSDNPLAGYESSIPTPNPPEDEEDCVPGRPVDITKWHGPETIEETEALRERRKAKSKDLVEACSTMIDCLGEDLNREGLLKTPLRMAKALQYFTSGYECRLSGT